MPSRRDILIGGVSTVLLGGLGWWAHDRGVFAGASGAPYEGWRLATSPDMRGTPLGLIAAGVLASNPHNSQPWLFAASEDRIDVYADLTRTLGAFDPFLRELWIGLGCAIENMVEAAPWHGYSVSVHAPERTLQAGLPTRGRLLAASLHLTPAAREGSLYAITGRRTNRGAYDPGREVGADMLARLDKAARAQELVAFHPLTEDRQHGIFDATMVEATERIITDEEMVAASDRWFRLTHDEIVEHRDGVTLPAVGLPPYILPIAKMMPRVGADESHKAWFEATRDVHLPTAPVKGILSVADPRSARALLATGRAWQRMHLDAASHGLAAHPMNQPMEVIDREAVLRREPAMARQLAPLMGDEGRHAVFAFRLGYARHGANPSPRRALSDVVVQG